MDKIILFVEGTNNKANGFLAQGFNKLLSKKLQGKMPKIIMAEDKHRAIKKFLNCKLTSKVNLLIDLDADEAKKQDQMNAHNLYVNKSSVFFMIHEMESWFISQPTVLDRYYCYKISKAIPDKHPKEIQNPSDFLHIITAPSKKGKYHKVRDGAELLALLDADRLMADFSDFNDLIEKLSKIN